MLREAPSDLPDVVDGLVNRIPLFRAISKHWLA